MESPNVVPKSLKVPTLGPLPLVVVKPRGFVTDRALPIGCKVCLVNLRLHAILKVSRMSIKHFTLFCSPSIIVKVSSAYCAIICCAMLFGNVIPPYFLSFFFFFFCVTCLIIWLSTSPTRRKMQGEGGHLYLTLLRMEKCVVGCPLIFIIAWASTNRSFVIWMKLSHMSNFPNACIWNPHSTVAYALAKSSFRIITFCPLCSAYVNASCVNNTLFMIHLQGC